MDGEECDDCCDRKSLRAKCRHAAFPVTMSVQKPFRIRSMIQACAVGAREKRLIIERRGTRGILCQAKGDKASANRRPSCRTCGRRCGTSFPASGPAATKATDKTSSLPRSEQAAKQHPVVQAAGPGPQDRGNRRIFRPQAEPMPSFFIDMHLGGHTGFAQGQVEAD